jgi:predicted esterase
MAVLALLSLAVLTSAAPARAISFKEALAAPDSRARYLIYLHGARVETQGKGAVSPRYGTYDHDGIVAAFEERDLVVIDEIRTQTNANRSAAAVTSQVRALMRAGVPPVNITVAGFSKGGYIALLVASSLGNQAVGYVIMAGCGKGRDAFAFDQFLGRNRGARLKGRMLSIYATSDMEAGSCQAAVAQAAGAGLVFREIRIHSGKGHGLFYQPRPEWITPVARWARGE